MGIRDYDRRRTTGWVSLLSFWNMVHPDEMATFSLFLTSNLVPPIIGTDNTIDGGAILGIILEEKI